MSNSCIYPHISLMITQNSNKQTSLFNKIVVMERSMPYINSEEDRNGLDTLVAFTVAEGSIPVYLDKYA